MAKISFNKPYITGKECQYILEAVELGKLSGDGMFTRKCQSFLEQRYGFGKCLLTTSCTDALEMAAILLDIAPGDEVIMPSFTFVSTANAFVLRGASIVFADCSSDNPNIDPDSIAGLITSKTKAIVVVHYAGVACDMDRIMSIAAKHGIFVVEDAAMAIDSFYKGRPLGSIGHLAAFSFHETKNIHCGEGGCLVVNEKSLIARSEIIREKGTNRSAFFRGEVSKYSWVDIGSSFLPSEINAAFLWAQLEEMDHIQKMRSVIWSSYDHLLAPLVESGMCLVPQLPDYASRNYHMFYVLLPHGDLRDRVIASLADRNIMAIFHYLPLHQSPYFAERYIGPELPNAIRFSETLLRLPFHIALGQTQLNRVANVLTEAVLQEKC
jgi:dTDP-4-amino-4,6-dideoxygalactose transaminase